MSPPPTPHPPPPTIVLEGRRSQRGLTLKSVEFGLYGASKYKVNTFLSLKVRYFWASLQDLLKYLFLFGISNGSAEPYVIFLGLLKNRK